MDVTRTQENNNTIEQSGIEEPQMDTEALDTSKEIINAAESEKDLTVRDIMSLKVGDQVDILVSSQNYKNKVFINKFTGRVEKKRCRISGTAKSDYYGLGFFVSPSMYSKGPFALYINEYMATWVAFYPPEEDNR